MKSNNIKILIVDDNEKNIQVVASLLAQNNYDVEYALSGFDALNLISTYNFDLILLDIMMPVMDGYEVCGLIKEMPEKKDIPIIFLTAKTDVNSIEKAFECGGQDYINKPFNSRELLTRVRNHIELKINRDKLEETNKWLETKVQERTQELRSANKKLLDLDNAKSKFINIISHEIRTPLTGIIGGLSLLRESGLSDDAASLIDLLDHSATRLENFSQKALDISLLNLYGKELLELKNTDINLEIDKITESIDKKDKNISFKKIIEGNDFKLNIDPELFHKSIKNILDNAVEFSPDESTVFLEIKDLENQLKINIKDEGIGFDKNFKIEDIEVFNNSEHVDTNPGLGLYLSNLIIKTHGGSIENGNNKDKGAYIKLVLPK